METFRLPPASDDRFGCRQTRTGSVSLDLNCGTMGAVGGTEGPVKSITIGQPQIVSKVEIGSTDNVMAR